MNAVTVPRKGVKAPICPHCDTAAVFRHSSFVYGETKADFGYLWVCPNYPECNTYVGCHRSSGVPLGRMANKELREAKKAAHAVFDPLWRDRARRDGVSKGRARGITYRWLALALGINPKSCQIAAMDLATCRLVVDVCSPYLRIGSKP